MAEQQYVEPVGAILHFPDGHNVTVTAGARIQVPAATVVLNSGSSAGPRELPTAGVVVAAGTVTAPPATGFAQPPPPAPHALVTTPSTPIKPATWDKTPQGVALETSYAAFRTAFGVTMPGQRQEFQAIARTPIGG
jgi:hypothetical protein